VFWYDARMNIGTNGCAQGAIRTVMNLITATHVVMVVLS
jgi:hypothetical protein